jgi:transcriptional antiterminator RfaH
MEKKWMVIYTKSRAEKKVEERLLQEGIEAYCPTYTTIKQWSDRKKKIEVPLLSSYVFVRIEEFERQKVMSITGVSNFVYWQGKPAVIREKEIVVLRNQLTNRIIPEGNIGDFITIKDGVFKGLEGIIKEIKANKTIITLESLGITIHITNV